MAATLALMANNTGFDFYFLASTQRSIEYIIESSGGWRIGDFYIPRYILGTHLLFFMSFAIIPFAWIIIMLHSLLAYYILKNARKLNPGYSIGGMAIIVINFVYMSMSGIGFLAIYCAYISYKNDKNWKIPFFIATAVHPVTFILSFFSLFLKKRFTALKILLFTSFTAIILGFLHSSIHGKNLSALFEKYLDIFLLRARFIAIIVIGISLLVIFFYL